MSNINIESLMGKADFSRGTERFAENLLGKCLSVLGQDSTAVEGFTEISDDCLDFLAAAGNPLENNNPTNDLI